MRIKYDAVTYQEVNACAYANISFTIKHEKIGRAKLEATMYKQGENYLFDLFAPSTNAGLCERFQSSDKKLRQIISEAALLQNIQPNDEEAITDFLLQVQKQASLLVPSQIHEDLDEMQEFLDFEKVDEMLEELFFLQYPSNTF